MLKVLLVSLLATNSTYIQSKLINRISNALEDTYDFFLERHEAADLETLQDLTLSKVILDDIERVAPEVLERLKKKAFKLTYKIKQQLEANEELLEKWPTAGFVANALDKNYTNLYVADNATEFLVAISYESFSKTFADECLLELVKGPECGISASCQHVMKDSQSIYSGRSVTFRVRYLQIARLTRCGFGKNDLQGQIRKLCSYILWEAENIRKFHLANELYDLLFEQISACGAEGYAEFMKPVFLNYTLKLQDGKGCYKLPYPEGNCSIRATGKATHVLSLFLKYYAQNLSGFH